MSVELDHLFICTAIGAPAARQLIEFGLTEGAPNRHPGQGTANRRFFFDNAMLELLWVCDAGEARSEVVRPLGLWERTTGLGSPFGVCFRPAGPNAAPPFAVEEYRPPYLPPPLAIHIAAGIPVTEPLWFYMDFLRGPAKAPDHPAGLRAMTHVRIAGPQPFPPRAAGIETAAGPEHFLEITFDGGLGGHSADFRPGLPLAFRW